MIRLLALLISLFATVALAEPVSVQLSLPSGLTAGKVPVSANLSALGDAKVSVAVDPGNGLEVKEVTLDKDGKGELELLGVSPATLVTLKVAQGGRNYAQTLRYQNQTSLNFVMDNVLSRRAGPLPLIPWAIGIIILGLLAIRGSGRMI
jgi:hypothetical protein